MARLPVLRTFPKRLFRLIQMVRRNTIVLIAAHKKEEVQAFENLRLGEKAVLMARPRRRQEDAPMAGPRRHGALL